MDGRIARGSSLGLLWSCVWWILRATPSAAAPGPAIGERPLAALFPPNTAVYVSSNRLADLLRAGDTHPAWRSFENSALGALTVPLLQERFDAALPALSEYAGTNWRENLSGLVEHGAAFGIARSSERPCWALVLRSRDGVALEAARLRAFEALGRRFGVPALADLPFTTHADARIWQLGPELTIALRDQHLIAGNAREYVDAIVANAAEAGALGLLVEPALAEALADGAGTADLFAWVDRERATLYEHGEAARDELEAQARAARDPGPAFLLGPALGFASAARSYSVQLRFTAEDPRLTLHAHELPIPEALLSRPATPAGLERKASDLLHATLHRDLAALLADRARLYDPEHLAGLAKGISDLSLFFMGKDLVEDVLPDVSAGWTLVSRPIDWGSAARPEQPLPAIAAVIELADPERDGPLFVAAFQSLVSIVNVERAQQGEEALVLELAVEGSIQLSCAHFRGPEKGEPVDLRYNLAPAIARVGSSLVVASHDSLARQLVRELAAASGPGVLEPQVQTRAVDAALEVLHLSGPGLAGVVAANAEALVANARLTQGKSEAQARREVNGLRLILEFVQSARFEVRRAATDTELRIELDLPAPGVAAAR